MRRAVLLLGASVVVAFWLIPDLMRLSSVELVLFAQSPQTPGRPVPAAEPAVSTELREPAADATEVSEEATASVPPSEAAVPTEPAEQPFLRSRYEGDLAAVREFRPAYPFWQHIFTIPDGRIVFGSGRDGRLLATFPTRGNWVRDGVWHDETLQTVLTGVRLQSRVNSRREQVSALLEPLVGPVVHNPARGRFVSPHAERYGRFLSQWGTIYERFGVPAEIGLAQAVLESGLNGRARSGAQALGFCQWLRRNWAHLNRLDPNVIEAFNQTTQAPYCAAHLTILSTMYGSFIPALSEHHAGGVNVGRTVINGMRLGGGDMREQYFMGSEFARGLRQISIQRYRDLFRTYGLRSFLYAEMVFGNTINIGRMTRERSQTKIYAMRTPRDLSMTEVRRKTGLSSDEVKRFNPALVRRVPARANVYLPSYVEEFGPDVSFWHRPAPPNFTRVLDQFVRLEPGVERWHDASFEPTLRDFEQRFEATSTEEGVVMATTLKYIISNLRSSRRAEILTEFRTSDRILRLFRQGLEELRSTLTGV